MQSSTQPGEGRERERESAQFEGKVVRRKICDMQFQTENEKIKFVHI